MFINRVTAVREIFILNIKYVAQYCGFYSSCLYLLQVSRSLRFYFQSRPVHCTVFSVNLSNYTEDQTIPQTKGCSRPKNTLDQMIPQTKLCPRPNVTVDHMVIDQMVHQTKRYSRPNSTIDQLVLDHMVLDQMVLDHTVLDQMVLHRFCAFWASYIGIQEFFSPIQEIQEVVHTLKTSCF